MKTKSKQKHIKELVEVEKAKMAKMKMFKGGKFVCAKVVASVAGGVRSLSWLAKFDGSNLRCGMINRTIMIQV